MVTSASNATGVKSATNWRKSGEDTTITNDWYETHIEEPIRPLVKLLRDNGFNTTCSCGHKLYVEMEQYCDGDVSRLYNLLWENGYKHFRITTWWEARESFNWNSRTMIVELLEDKYGVKLNTSSQVSPRGQAESPRGS